MRGVRVAQHLPHAVGRVVLPATIGLPAARSASLIAAHTVCMGAPPPSPMPFVPSGVNGDGDSIASTFTGGMSSAWGTW